MVWLAIHMWALLFAAFGVGLATGWWMRGAPKRRSRKTARPDAPLGTLDSDAPGAA